MNGVGPALNRNVHRGAARRLVGVNELVATLTVSIASIEGMYWIVSDAPKFRVPAPSTRVSLLLMFPPLTVNASERVGLAPKEWPLVGGETPGMVTKSIW